MTGDESGETLLRALANARAEVERLEAELMDVGVITGAEPEDRYRILLENSADAIFIMDGDTFVDCNRATVEMFGFTDKNQLLEMHPSEVSPPHQPDGVPSYEKANSMLRLALRRGSHRFEWDHIRSNGETFPAEVLLTPISEAGRGKFHAVVRDITGRKELESQLRQSQKMEAMGRLAGGIAHDFNNLLMVINGNTERLLSTVGDDTDAAAHLRQITWAGQRATELTAQLLASSRRQVLQPAILDLNRITVRAHDLLRRLIGEDIELNTRPSEEPAMFKADPGLIEQVIINLATNAMDAMPDGGRLDLEVSVHDLDESTTVDCVDLPPARYARLRVTDTGAGMAPRVLEQAFEPFFTTKPIGEGSGLGLSMVYGIVQQSGGHVIIRSAVATGTSVEIWFPTVDKPATHSATAPEQECWNDEAVSGDETILVVEDDESVAAVILAMLSEVGYTVVTCQNGLEALEIFAERGEEVALILSDVVMPHMGGPELIKELAGQGPVPPVIFASGYTDDLLGSFDQLEFDATFLQKPFNRSTLLHAVRTKLDRPNG